MGCLLVGLFTIIFLPIALIGMRAEKRRKEKQESARLQQKATDVERARVALRDAGYIISKKIVTQRGALFVDDERKAWGAFLSGGGPQLKMFSYAAITSFELTENGQSIVSSTAGESMLGGLVFGAAGAVIGAASEKTVSQKVKSIDVRIYVNDLAAPQVIMPFLANEVDSSSDEYKAAYERAKDVLATLQYIQKNAGQGRAQYPDRPIYEAIVITAPKEHEKPQDKWERVAAVMKPQGDIPKCVRCGKSGKRLWLSKSGYCMKCAEAVLREREKEKMATVPTPVADSLAHGMPNSLNDGADHAREEGAGIQAQRDELVIPVQVKHHR